MKQVLFVLLFTAVSFAAEPIEKIKGAFGIELGQSFDPEKAIGTSQLTDGTPMYQFAPVNPYRAFSQYFVMLTPKSNKVYAIWGVGAAENTAAGKKEQAVLMSILAKKYGKPAEQGLTETMYDLTHVVQGDRRVMVKISGFGKVTIDIRYEDAALEKQAEKERIEVEAAKVQSKGL